MALPDKWVVVVSGSEMLGDLVRRPDEELSLQEGVEEVRNMIVRPVLRIC